QRHRMSAAGHRVDAAQSGYLPQVDLQVGARHTDNPGQAFMTKINQARATQKDFAAAVVNDPDPTTDIATSLELRQPIYRGGATTAQVAQAESGVAGATQGLQRTKLNVALGATRAFLGVQLAQSRVKVTKEALEAAREHLRMAENRYQAGTALRSDMLQARTRVSELEERLLSQENGLAIATSKLNEQLGRDLDAPVNVDGNLRDHNPVEAPSLNALTERALNERPEIQRSRAQVDGARAQADEAQAGLRPHVSLRARLEDHRAGESDQSWLVGAQMNWRLYGGGRRASEQAATAERFAAESRLTDTMRKVRLEVKEAKLNLETARKRLTTVRHAVESAQESLRTNANRYEQGASTIVELLDAQLARHQARQRQIKALYDLRLSHAQLQKAVGRLPVLEQLAAGSAQ
ncbi:MAG TPA: TolC family protein, partial [Gammaproteobacteria bacterium]|nr:TolC family protein [Gammaproteobacteria bacterium]